MGRKPTYTDKHREQILLLLEDGATLRQICRMEDMPSPSMVLKWCDTIPSFGEQYAKARMKGYHAIAEEIFDIADDGTNDWELRENKDGTEYVAFNNEHYQRSRLRVDTRKWFLGKVLPKIYGDKVQVDATIQDERETSTLELAKAAALLLSEGIEEQEETRH